MEKGERSVGNSLQFKDSDHLGRCFVNDGAVGELENFEDLEAHAHGKSSGATGATATTKTPTWHKLTAQLIPNASSVGMGEYSSSRLWMQLLGCMQVEKSLQNGKQPVIKKL